MNSQPIVVEEKTNYVSSIGSYLHLMNNPGAFKFQAKNAFLIYQISISNVNETNQFITCHLKNICGEGTINIRHEGDLILVLAMFENKISTRNYQFFNIMKYQPWICTFEKNKLSIIEEYITGIKNIPLKKSTLSEMISAESTDGCTDLLYKAASFKTDFNIARYVHEVMRECGVLISKEDSYKWSRRELIWKKMSAEQGYCEVVECMTNYIHHYIRSLKNDLVGNISNNEKTIIKLMNHTQINELSQAEVQPKSDNELKQEKAVKDELIKNLSSLLVIIQSISQLKKYISFVRGYTTIAYDDFIEKLDKDPIMAPIRNGKIVNLITGEIMDRNSTHKVSFEFPVNYNPDMPPNKRIDDFLENITLGRKDLLNYLLEEFGYAITGLTYAQAAYFLLGVEGSNGKSTLMGMIAKCIGSKFFKSVPKSLIFKEKGASIRDDQAPTAIKTMIQGSHIVYVSEPSPTDEINLTQFKKLTGNDGDNYRKMGGEFKDYTPQFKLVIPTNKMPMMPKNSSTDGGAWRRPIVIPCDCKFVDTKEEMVKPNCRLKDPDFISNILDDQNAMDYFFSLLVKGAIRHNIGKGNRKKPACVLSAVQEYKSEQNIYAQFIQECCIHPPTSSLKRTSAKDLLKAFKTWTQDEFGKSDYSSKDLGNGLTAMGVEKGKSNTIYYIIDLIAENSSFNSEENNIKAAMSGKIF